MGVPGKDSFDALARYLKLVEDPKLGAAALLAVMNQRLVRKLCTTCREAFKPDETLLKKLNLPVSKIEYFYRTPTQPILDKKGNEIICQSCQGSGYLGRTGVFELLVLDDTIKGLIAKQAPMDQVKNAARKNKMYYLQEEGLLKVMEGVTSLDEIIRGLRDDGK
jgi:type II secretory ATPase GspE/PulE/Tfp pilus assembly ATPase PilB-like protein